jgi:hypothetical protein
MGNGLRAIEVDGVRGFLSYGDPHFFLKLPSSLPPGGRYLEVGSWMGLSSMIVLKGALSRGNFSAKIFCVDTWEGSVEHAGMDIIENQGLFDVFLQNIRRTGACDWITPLRGRSTDIAKTVADESFDIIFIDGDHTFDGCYADLVAWLPKVKKNGRFLGHDAIEVENPSCGVRSAVDRFCRERGFTYTIAAPPISHFVWEINRHGR